MKRRAAEKEIEEREDANIRRKKEESDRLYSLYLEEKQRQRQQDAQANSQSHLKQIVRRTNAKKQQQSFIETTICFCLFVCSKNEKIVNAKCKPVMSMKFKWINI